MAAARPWLLLDLAGVLLRFEPERRIALLGSLSGQGEAAVRARIAASGITERLDTGRADEDALRAFLGALLGRAIGTDEAWRLWLSPFAPERAVLDDVPPLGTRFRLGVFTNNPRAITRVFDASPFERMFFSAELGAKKPDPATYDAVGRALDVPARSIVFVDDGEANIEGARRAGWQAIAFRAGDGLARLLPG